MYVAELNKNIGTNSKNQGASSFPPWSLDITLYCTSFFFIINAQQQQLFLYSYLSQEATSLSVKYGQYGNNDLCLSIQNK